MSPSTVVAFLNRTELQAGSPFDLFWTTPALLISSLMIAWAAEATQFYLAQGVALALLALLQTLPEFAVEAVLAWHRAVEFLFANLTGALMLLTGLGWPMIYFSAATSHRKAGKGSLRRIQLAPDQAVQIFALLLAIAYQATVWWKGSLTLVDGIVLLSIYLGYLWVMSRLPPAEPEGETSGIPGAIVRASRPLRIASILTLFLIGGAAVFLVAGPFLSSIFGLSTMLGISSFRFIQWVAPLASEAPEGISAFYWARDYERAPMALMNLVSSNINQWTLLASILPIILSVSVGHVAAIPLDAAQEQDVLMTLSQSFLGAILLLNMELSWWEAAGLFVLFICQIGFSSLHTYVTWVNFGWGAIELIRLLAGPNRAVAWRHLCQALSPAHK